MEGKHLVRSRPSVTFVEELLFTNEEPEDVRDVSHPQGHVRGGSSARGNGRWQPSPLVGSPSSPLHRLQPAQPIFV